MNAINIGGNKIPWSFVQKVRKKAGGDWDVTMDIFWKARNCYGGPAGIMKYIEAGFKTMLNGAIPYNMQPSDLRENGQMEKIRKWWNGEVYKPKKAPVTMKEIFRALAQDVD